MLSAELFRGRRSQLAKIVLLLCGLYFAVSFAGQAWKAKNLSDVLAQERSQLTQQQTQNARLQARLNFLSGKGYAAYAEREARDKLNMARKGDHYVFVVPKEVASTEQQPAALPNLQQSKPVHPAAEPNWKQWLRMFFPQQ